MDEAKEINSNDPKREKVRVIPLSAIDDAPDHPFGVRDDEEMAELMESISTFGVEDKYYDLDFTLDEIRPSYRFDVTCMGSVPQAIECFLEAEDFEDAIRNAISLGGDGDTIAAIAGAIAEAYFGIPDELQEEAMEYMDDNEKDWYGALQEGTQIRRSNTCRCGARYS